MWHTGKGEDEFWIRSEGGLFNTKRKPWRRRLWWYNDQTPHRCYAILIKQEKAVPLHNVATATRKPWSQSKRIYHYYDGTYSLMKLAPAHTLDRFHLKGA